MKIAQVCPRYHPDIGGVETHAKEISERLVDKGFDVEVITTDPIGYLPKRDWVNDVKIIRFKSFAPNDSYYIAPQMYSYIKKSDYDIVHAHNYHALPSFFACLATPCNEKFVFNPYYHGKGHTKFRNLLHYPYAWLGSKIFSRADKVICISQYEMDLVKERFNVPRSKLILIPSGLDLKEFEGLESIKKDYKTILFVGRLERYKGVQHVIKVLLELKGVRLEIIGKGPYERELKKLANNLGVSNRIDWIKNLSRAELLRHYKSASVFVMLSTHEAYGIVVAEALASGTPCIVAGAGALSEFVDDKMCFGVTFPTKANDLAEVIEHTTSIKRVRYGRNLVDWDNVTERLIDVYEEIR